MFRTLKRLFLPNPFDRMLAKAKAKGHKRIVLGWNRGLGDIALGLYAMVERIRKYIPNAEITFVTRENLLDGFSMLDGVKAVALPWKRGEKVNVKLALQELQISYDLLIEAPNPTAWVRWQIGTLQPKLKWDAKHDPLFEKFDLEGSYVGVQVVAETSHGPWRNWPLERFQKLFDELEKRDVKVLLFGFGNEVQFKNSNIVDLRGKTTLFELLSIIKHKCFSLVLPDSGIASILYYLNESFPIRLISLWADIQGILKQRVSSPNPKLLHVPLIGKERNLSNVSVEDVLREVIHVKPLYTCRHARDVRMKPVIHAGAIILAGGQGTRLGVSGPKGLFEIEGKTLFAWALEKAPKMPIAVMTSPINHEETVTFFEKHENFRHDVHFFQQEMKPLLDVERTPMKELGPNGNGSVFRSFAKAGLQEVFRKKGVEIVTVSAVDNPLTELFDPALISYAREEKADAVVQCIQRQEGKSMGALVERRGIEILEYTELDPNLECKFAYIGQMAFDFSFFCKMAKVKLPVHFVKKKMGDKVVWKGEEFIFDVLPLASSVRALEVERQIRYAPLKGLDSVDEAKMLLREKR